MKTEWFKHPLAKTFADLALRVFLCALLLGGLAYGMLWGAVSHGPGFFDEVGPVETLESIFALLTALTFLVAGRVDKTRAPCVIMLAWFLFCLFIRESDHFLAVLISRHAWKVLVSFMLVLVFIYIVKNGKRVMASILEFLNQPSFGIFLSGLLVLVVFSRLFGYGGFWKELLDVGQYKNCQNDCGRGR